MYNPSVEALIILLKSYLAYIGIFLNIINSYLHFETTNSLHLDYRQFERYVKDMQERYKDSFQHPYLRPVKTVFL